MHIFGSWYVNLDGDSLFKPKDAQYFSTTDLIKPTKNLDFIFNKNQNEWTSYEIHKKIISTSSQTDQHRSGTVPEILNLISKSCDLIQILNILIKLTIF
ncbi:hypothetical protein BpHYR1_044553 [Brachionus plicatilis]|uniref:Uncharacterized protein n=1 Tax=Brachionus plicatilis TaxID=10195 RepID=A0A3M7R141_BRAPC|nr:hypothetical protein BpHYR1_044553 [Brachionus plicatilis]